MKGDTKRQARDPAVALSSAAMYRHRLDQPPPTRTREPGPRRIAANEIARRRRHTRRARAARRRNRT